MNKSYCFDGGLILNKVSCTFFISYLYYKKIDHSHMNWQRITNKNSLNSRIYRVENYTQYYNVWIDEITKMNPNNLGKNSIGLSGYEVIEMAKKLQKYFKNGK